MAKELMKPDSYAINVQTIYLEKSPHFLRACKLGLQFE